MKLRKPCEHGFYDEHSNIPERDPSDPIGTIRGPFFPCPGGVFLPDDTLIIEKVDIDREALAAALEPRLIDPVFLPIYQAAKLVLDALSVREAE